MRGHQRRGGRKRRGVVDHGSVPSPCARLSSADDGTRIEPEALSAVSVSGTRELCALSPFTEMDIDCFGGIALSFHELPPPRPRSTPARPFESRMCSSAPCRTRAFPLLFATSSSASLPSPPPSLRRSSLMPVLRSESLAGAPSGFGSIARVSRVILSPNAVAGVFPVSRSYVSELSILPNSTRCMKIVKNQLEYISSMTSNTVVL